MRTPHIKEHVGGGEDLWGREWVQRLEMCCFGRDKPTQVAGKGRFQRKPFHRCEAI